MKLMHTGTLVVDTFPNLNVTSIPDYVALSHRWGDREVTLQEIENPPPGLHDTEGYKKIQNCCKQAASVGFEYVWIDTCCIDKTNQSELTEAINSMFSWYRNAQVCYSYLSDVPSNEDPCVEDSKFRQSTWFTRGWTLQELIAPLHLTFFAEDWEEVGTKASLNNVISDVTGITSQVLLTNHAGEVSIAQRMAWASKRETWKVEDQAYCLMGLFNVNMPLMYGEGERAFTRLQHEILKMSDDHSIFSWTDHGWEESRGLLATSPADFKDCSHVRRLLDDTSTSAFSMTNKGLNIKLPLIRRDDLPNGECIGVLSCQQNTSQSDGHPLGIRLQSVGRNSYVRVATNTIETITSPVDFNNQTDIYVKEEDLSRFDVSQWMKVESIYTFSIRKRPRGIPSIHENSTTIWKVTDEDIRLSFACSGHSGIFIFKNGKGQMFVVNLGVHNYNVWCDVAANCGHEDVKAFAAEYWDGARRHCRWDNLDRGTTSLLDGKSVSVVVRKGRLDGKRAYIVDISAGEDFFLDKVGPGCCLD